MGCCKSGLFTWSDLLDEVGLSERFCDNSNNNVEPRNSFVRWIFAVAKLNAFSSDISKNGRRVSGHDRIQIK